MAEQTGISWCDSTANLWAGCQKVSPACDNCYAEHLMDTRLHKVAWGPHGDRVRIAQGWTDLRKWQRAADRNGGVDPQLGRRRRVFINSLSDFFDNHRSIPWRGEAWELFRRCPSLEIILLTKRPQNIPDMLPEFWAEIAGRVWLMTTVENQDQAILRINALLDSCVFNKQPACFGISFEPLLGPLDLSPWLWGPPGPCRDCDCECGWQTRKALGLPHIGWAVVGGESGGRARHMDIRWPLGLLHQCIAAGVAFHFKQLSQADYPNTFRDFESFYPQLRVREFPL